MPAPAFPAILAATALLLLAVPAQASPVASRGALQSLLAGQGTLEDFEAYSVPKADAQYLDCGSLSATTTCNGQGPGLVRPGATYSSLNTLIWDGTGYFWAPSREILAYDSTSIVINFDTPAQAAGLDVRTFEGTAVPATVEFYGPDGTTLLASIDNITLAADRLPQFFGWQDDGGIGRIVVSQGYRWWSPQIDNVEFGAIVATPEPATAALLGVGIVAMALRRRSM